MRHDITVEGEYFRIRPVTIEDAAFIVALRNDPERSRFIHPISPHVADQEQWLERYFERPGDYYFIVEEKQSGRAEGTLGIYDLNTGERCAEWGRWVLRHGSTAALESAILVYRAAFETLELDMVYCRTVSENVRVVSFHKSLGLITHGRIPDQFELNGLSYDAVEQRMTRAAWQDRQAALEAKARWAGKLYQSAE